MRRTPPPYVLLCLLAALAPLGPDADPLTGFFPDPEERRRYRVWLKRLSMKEFSVVRLCARAGLEDREDEVRAALLADDRFERLQRSGPDCFRLKREHRHVGALSRQEDASHA